MLHLSALVAGCHLASETFLQALLFPTLCRMRHTAPKQGENSAVPDSAAHENIYDAQS